MKQRKLGRGGPVVSALGLGCMGMSDVYGGRDDHESSARKKDVHPPSRIERERWNSLHESAAQRKLRQLTGCGSEGARDLRRPAHRRPWKAPPDLPRLSFHFLI